VSPQFGILVLPLDIVTMAEKLLDQEQKLYKLVKVKYEVLGLFLVGIFFTESMNCMCSTVQSRNKV
jgi:hypothetical protein